MKFKPVLDILNCRGILFVGEHHFCTSGRKGMPGGNTEKYRGVIHFIK